MLARPGGAIAYDVTGNGPLVVCIPGMGELRSSYRYTVPALREAGLRVACMDLRGHGDSDATFDRYDDVAAGEDAVALADHLGASQIVLVGNSMGAGAAVWAAAERPELVAGVALLGPFVRNTPDEPAARPRVPPRDVRALGAARVGVVPAPPLSRGGVRPTSGASERPSRAACADPGMPAPSWPPPAAAINRRSPGWPT